MRKALVICALLGVVLPGRAAAEWHFTPGIGITFGKGSNLLELGDPDSGALARRNRHVGFTVSRLGEGIFGVEGSVTWTPSFFEGRVDPLPGLDPEGPYRALTVMGNVVLTTPRLWTEYSLRPFVSGGVGLMHLRAAETVFPLAEDFSAFNVGAGAIGFLSDRTGVRFDARYHSTLGRKDVDPRLTRDAQPLHLRYFTASIGFVIRTGVRSGVR
jgi:hypothetical protein